MQRLLFPSSGVNPTTAVGPTGVGQILFCDVQSDTTRTIKQHRPTLKGNIIF